VRKYLHTIAFGFLGIGTASAGMQSMSASPAVHLPASVTTQGNAIGIDGDVTFSVLQQVQAIVRSSPSSVREISVHSTGGDLESLMELGELIHEHRINLRIDRLCAAACAAFLPSAAASLDVPVGSLVVLAQLPTPKSAAAIASSVATNSVLRLKAVNAIIDRENAYFRGIGVDSGNVYAAVDMIDDVRAKLASGEPFGRLGLALDPQSVKNCLGVSNVKMTAPKLDDTIGLTHLGKTPFAFLLSGAVYFEGKQVLKSGLRCAASG